MPSGSSISACMNLVKVVPLISSISNSSIVKPRAGRSEIIDVVFIPVPLLRIRRLGRSVVALAHYYEGVGIHPTAVARGPVGAVIGLGGHVYVGIAAGVGLLVLGSKFLVDGASTIARHFGVSDLTIGLTIVAAGTSLPEIATSIIAGVKGQRDIAVGNAIGSNLFNILFVLGLSGIVSPNGLPVPPEALRFDLWVMLGVSVLMLPVFFSGYRISRWEGAVFVVFYGLYLSYLILAASEHRALSSFTFSALLFVIPLVILMSASAIYKLVFRGRKRSKNGSV